METEKTIQIPTKKIILKTASVTALLFIMCLIIAVSSVFLFAPQFTANSLYRMGSYKLSARVSASVYKKSNDINDLGTLVDRSIISQKHDYVVTYAAELRNHKHYTQYCAYVNDLLSQQNPSYSRFNYDYYVTGNYTFSLYNFGRGDELTLNRETAFLLATNYMATQNGYGTNNPMTYLVNAITQSQDTTHIERLNQWLENRYSQMQNQDKDQLKNLCKDAYDFNTKINNAVSQTWLDRYNQI